MPPEIRIVGLYEDAVSTSQAGDTITSIVLRLSDPPDEAWVEAFHHEWALTSYPRKRNARVGAVRVSGSTAARRGLVLFASPEDYVDKHKRYLEDAVLRANDRVRQRTDRRDETIAEAARTIREINRTHYGDAAPSSTVEASATPVIRLAI
ncbi:hypothetical protein [Rubrivirga marina]|uniref:Uncharacterized protein n=1 Tax=Rubrivirga marina TaxID=1196024 RepID=A0A271J1G7_9BACT|nr:hypothetical protein [Rubrivirga marina]PAP76805.1 hypothetical protein BSZ37_10355 [Rubrivirga marina]